MRPKLGISGSHGDMWERAPPVGKCEYTPVFPGTEVALSGFYGGHFFYFYDAKKNKKQITTTTKLLREKKKKPFRQ